MKKQIQTFSVNFSYPVHFTRKLFSPSNPVLLDVLDEKRAKVVFFVDDGVIRCHPNLDESITTWRKNHSDRIEHISPINVIPGGETIKNDLSILDDTARIVEKAGLCRHSYIIVVGGGAALDAVGFAASLVYRGIRHIRIPTTMLSQLDSGVGVKNGINRFNQKNYYGTFTVPWAVINDFDFLETLEQRDWASGLAEAFKVAIIKDKKFLEFLKQNAAELAKREPTAMEYTVTRCARLHLNHIRGSDPFETGSSRPLDFGHWAAHHLEVLSGFKLRHGEAVAIGIAIDLFCSVELGLIRAEECEYVLDAMELCGISLWHSLLDNCDKPGTCGITQGIEEFRRHQGGEFTLMMPKGLGNVVAIHALPDKIILKAVRLLEKRKQKK